MTPADLRRYCTPDAAGEKLREQAMTKLALSARAYTRILKVILAWNLGYISAGQYTQLRDGYDSVGRMLARLAQALS